MMKKPLPAFMMKDKGKAPAKAGMKAPAKAGMKAPAKAPAKAPKRMMGGGSCK